MSDRLNALLLHTEELIARGYSVSIATEGFPLRWRSSTAEWLHVDSLRALDTSAFDLVIADVDGIAVNDLVPGGRLWLLGPDDLAPVVDRRLFRSSALRDNVPLRVLLSGSWHSPDDALEDAYGAATHARWCGAEFELVRLSQWAPSREEPLEHVAEYVVASTAEEAARALHGSDVVVCLSAAPRLPLIAAEAMASSLPLLLTATPAMQALDPRHDYALFAPPGDPEAAGDQLVRLIADDVLRSSIARRARAVAEMFRSEVAAREFEEKLRARLKNEA